MSFDPISYPLDQASQASILESECPVCGNDILSETETEDIYCSECKSIVFQNSLANTQPN